MKANQKRVEKYIKKIQPTVCPLCGHRNWSFSDKIFQLLEFDEKGIVLGGAAFPVIPLTCDNCGNTYLINALLADLLDRPNTSDNPNITEEGK